MQENSAQPTAATHPAASLPSLSKRALESNPFRAMAIGEEADRMIAQGVDVVKLSLGEPDFGAPQAVRVVESGVVM